MAERFNPASKVMLISTLKSNPFNIPANAQYVDYMADIPHTSGSADIQRMPLLGV